MINLKTQMCFYRIKNFLKKRLPFVLVIFIASYGHSADKNPAEFVKNAKVESKENITAIMSDFSNHLLNLEILTLSRDKFKDPKNAEIISEHLKKMVEISKKASHTDQLKNNLGLKFSRDLLQLHLEETERVFRLGNPEYAQWMIHTTSNICLSCHTQMPGMERHFDSLANDKDKKISPFEKAELLFTFRSFDRAVEIYDEIIQGYPKNGIKIDKLELAIQRKLAYFVRVRQSPKSAIDGLNKNILNKRLPQVVRKTMKDWIIDLKNWDKTPTPSVETAKVDEIRKFIETLSGGDLNSKGHFNNDQMIAFLRISGFLYQYLSRHERSDFTGEILYWLALADRRLSNELFYSLADVYLKDCIREYSKLPIAKKCFTEYKEGIEFSYTGSSGTNIPPEVQAELKDLELLVNPKTTKE